MGCLEENTAYISDKWGTFLGGTFPLEITSASSFNDINSSCRLSVFIASSTITDGPFTGTYRGFLVVYDVEAYKYQEYVDCNDKKGRKWIRTYNAAGWTSWIELTT